MTGVRPLLGRRAEWPAAHSQLCGRGGCQAQGSRVPSQRRDWERPERDNGGPGARVLQEGSGLDLLCSVWGPLLSCPSRHLGIWASGANRGTIFITISHEAQRGGLSSLKSHSSFAEGWIFNLGVPTLCSPKSPGFWRLQRLCPGACGETKPDGLEMRRCESQGGAHRGRAARPPPGDQKL